MSLSYAPPIARRPPRRQTAWFHASHATIAAVGSRTQAWRRAHPHPPRLPPHLFRSPGGGGAKRRSGGVPSTTRSPPARCTRPKATLPGSTVTYMAPGRAVCRRTRRRRIDDRVRATSLQQGRSILGETLQNMKSSGVVRTSGWAKSRLTSAGP